MIRRKKLKEIESIKVIVACTSEDLEERINSYLKSGYCVHEIKPIDDPNGYVAMLITYKSEEE